MVDSLVALLKRPEAFKIIVALGAVIVAWLLAAPLKRLVQSAIAGFTHSWQLSLLATTALVLSAASGWTTWEGMVNFTGEPYLSLMITFGIQGLMLIIAWLIGESFAAGMSQKSGSGRSPIGQAAGGIVGFVAFAGICLLLLTSMGVIDTDHLIASGFTGSELGRVMLIGAVGALVVAALLLNNKSAVVSPYLQTVRVMAKNAMLWVMFLACMASSVFFAFDSRFNAIFPKEERKRVADIRAVNEVSGVVAEVGSLISKRRMEEADKLFASREWATYDKSLNNLVAEAKKAPVELEQFFAQKMRDRLAVVTRKEEERASADTSRAGLDTRKISLAEELVKLKLDRPALAAEAISTKGVVDDVKKKLDDARILATSEERGVDGTGKVGKGAMYRERMAAVAKLEAELGVRNQSFREADRRLSELDRTLKSREAELAQLDGEIGKLKAAAESAGEQIRMARSSGAMDAPRVDPTGQLIQVEKLRQSFRQEPTKEALGQIQTLCASILVGLSEVPSLKERARSIDCDPGRASEAVAPLFALNTGSVAYKAACEGGDKLPQTGGTDELLTFAGKCVQDSGLPAKDTASLRQKLAGVSLNRDDRAHRFVVTWNAFMDGNRLAYIALSISIGIDSLILLAGLFGATAVRSPLSDVPSVKARTGAQLEKVIDNSLLPNTFENARIVLEAMHANTSRPGFTAIIDVTGLDHEARVCVQEVLKAGTSIGAVESDPAVPSLYWIRGELYEHLAIVSKRSFEAAGGTFAESIHESHQRAELEKAVTVALLPHVGLAAEMVLSHIHPINGADGFASDGFMGEVLLDQIKPADVTSARNVLLAGRTMHKVRRQKDAVNAYEIHADLYKALARIRARALLTTAHTAIGAPAAHAVNPTALSSVAAPTSLRITHAEPRPAPAADPALRAHASPRSDDERRDAYWDRLVSALGLVEPAVARQRIEAPDVVPAATDAWRNLTALGQSHPEFGRWIAGFSDSQNNRLEEAYHRLIQEQGPAGTDAWLIEQAKELVGSHLQVLMLFPEHGLLNYLIDGIEDAAALGELRPGEQGLKDQLVRLRDEFNGLDLALAGSWRTIGRLIKSMQAEGAAGQAGNESRVVPMTRRT